MATCGRNSRLNLFDIRLNNNNGPVSDIAFVNYVVGGDQNCIGYNGDYISVGNSLGQIYSLDLRNLRIIEDKVSNSSIISMQQSKDSCIFIDQIGDLKMYNITNGNYLLLQNVSGGEQLTKRGNIEYIKDHNKIITRSNTNDRQVQILSIELIMILIKVVMIYLIIVNKLPKQSKLINQLMKNLLLIIQNIIVIPID